MKAIALTLSLGLASAAFADAPAVVAPPTALPTGTAPATSPAAAPASAPDGASDSPLAIWSDPAFQKAFLGSYGTISELEPRVTQPEREGLEKVLPLMSTDLPAATHQLEALCTPEASAVLDFTLGNLLFQQDQLDGAMARYETAIKKFPGYRRAWKNLGVVQVRKGLYEPSVKSLSRVLEMGGGDALTYGLLGFAYSAIGQPMSAESAYRNATLLQPDVTDWSVGLLQALLKEQKFGEAASLSGEMLAKKTDRADLWLLQAAAYLGLEQPLQAAANYEIVRRMGKATPATLWTLGDIYVNQSLWEPAGKAYLQAMDIDTAATSARPLRAAEALAQRGAFAPARAILDRVTKAQGEATDPEDKRRVLHVSAQIAAAEGNGPAATAALDELVRIDPLDGQALMLLAEQYARQNDPDRAIFTYERAEAIEGFEADARLRHARILVARSQFSDALPLLKRAQELKPREDVARYTEQVERLARAQR